MYVLSKILFVLFMLNYIWLSRLVGGLATMNYVLFAGFAATGLLSVKGSAGHRMLDWRLNRYAIYWLVFTAYTFLSGAIVACDFAAIINQTTFLIEVFFIIIYVDIVLETEGSLKFFYYVFMLVAILYTISLLQSGVTKGRSERLYLTEKSNPNSDGIVLAFGIYSGIKLIDTKRLVNLLPLSALSIIELYAILLTGSRKALIIAVSFCIIGVLRVWSLRSRLSESKTLLLAIVLLISSAAAARWLIPIFLKSTAYARMQNADIGMQDRWKIAHDALSIFSQYPVFGVGINNYKTYSLYGLYAHSTIPELLAGTGLIGTILFSLPYIDVARTIRRLIKIDFDCTEVIYLFTIILILSFVMIIPYSMPLCFFSTLLFMETALARKQSSYRD